MESTPLPVDLVIVPDGELHLLPFSALVNTGAYVLASHTVDVAPSSIAFELLKEHSEQQASAEMPYIGVAAWTQAADGRNPVVRAISGPEKDQFVPLPHSETEVEAIARDLPQPNTILLGRNATETNFKRLSGESADVIHLALHGYADVAYPDRSALIFAPEPNGPDDGLLQAREIRELHIRAKLVTLSACDTGVGPVGETEVTNVVNAFIEAGADSVVSTVWDLDDESTEHLMTTFYSHLASRQRKVDALRLAQLEMLNKGLPPYFGRAFRSSATRQEPSKDKRNRYDTLPITARNNARKDTEARCRQVLRSKIRRGRLEPNCGPPPRCHSGCERKPSLSRERLPPCSPSFPQARSHYCRNAPSLRRPMRSMPVFRFARLTASHTWFSKTFFLAESQHRQA
jgi:CHAT domain-containing protein